MTTIFTVARNGEQYQVIMTIIANQYVIDTAQTEQEAVEKAAVLNRVFARKEKNEADKVDG